MDPGFLNDSTIYYNFPAASQKEGKRRSTLPRPHSSFIFDRSSSCPSSPKLSIFKPKIVDSSLRQNNSLVRSSNLDRRNKVCDSSRLSDSQTSACRGKEKIGEYLYPQSNGTLGHSEVVYQNVNSDGKSRKKSAFFPWWKRKKRTSEAEKTTQRMLSSQLTIAPSIPETTVFPAEDKETLGNPKENLMPSNNYLTFPTHTSSCSSSTTTLNDDDGSGSVVGERVLGGISYVRPTTVMNETDQNDKDVSRRLSLNTSPNAELSGKIGHWVREWRRKSRWLSRRRREKNPRHSGEGDVDIALIHCDNDTSLWADYLSNNFFNLLKDKLGRPQVRVEKINIESFSDYQQVPEVQSSRINNAKLQIVILSPGFLSFLESKSELHFGKLLRPNRVLSLLLGVTKETIQDSTSTLSFLYSFDEWTCLHVRDRDEAFVSQVQEESLRILTHCDLFDQCKTSSPFNVCPRKITQSYCRMYIHLKSPLTKEQETRVRVTVTQSPSKSCSIPSLQCHNPYTLSLVMPEMFLGVSSVLKVNLYLEDRLVGSREVKCEGPLEVLNDILKSAVDPTALMCQALGISPASNDLDELLTQKVKGKIPISKHLYVESSEDPGISYHELPTWLHFSAFYGLQSFTWALLDVPSVEKVLRMKNSRGHTPAKLALQSGYTKLAQDLENLVIVTSLALKSSGQQFSSLVNTSYMEDYNHVPNPRPYTPGSPDLPSYDTPPHPRLYNSLRDSLATEENLTSTPKGDVTNYANLLLSSPSLLSEGGSVQSSLQEHEEEEYLDMSGTNSQLEEYQKDISILVAAWDKRNDARTFLNKYEHTISKLKENLHYKATNSDSLETNPSITLSPK